MNIFQIMCFVTLARSHTFYETAEKLYISQSSFSNNIQAIESELGVSLISRGTRGFTLTAAGREFLYYAEKIDGEYVHMKNMLAEYKNNLGHRVNIYADPLSSYGYNDMFVLFKLREPAIQTEITELHQENIAELLKENKNSVGIIFSKAGATLPGMKTKTILHDNFIALINKNHRLSGHHSLRMQDLKGEALQIISRKQSVFLYEHILKQCRKADFSPNISPYDLWYSTIISVAHQMSLTAVIPEKAARIFCPEDMQILEITDSEPFSIALVISEECTHDAARLFFDFTDFT